MREGRDLVRAARMLSLYARMRVTHREICEYVCKGRKRRREGGRKGEREGERLGGGGRGRERQGGRERE